MAPSYFSKNISEEGIRTTQHDEQMKKLLLLPNILVFDHWSSNNVMRDSCNVVSGVCKLAIFFWRISKIRFSYNNFFWRGRCSLLFFFLGLYTNRNFSSEKKNYFKSKTCVKNNKNAFCWYGTPLGRSLMLRIFRPTVYSVN